MKLSEKLISYLRSTKEEVRKVSWPTRMETIRYSGLVIGVSVIVAVFFATLDLGFTKLVDVAVTERNAARTSQNAPAAQPVAAPTTGQTAQPTLDLKDLQTTPVQVDTNEQPVTTQAPVTK